MGLPADVTEVVQAVAPPQLVGSHLEEPTVGTQADPGALRVSGWVLARHSPVVAVELHVADAIVARSASLGARPDIAAAFPGLPGADRAGFQLTIAGAWRETIQIRVLAVLADQSRCQIGTIVAGRPSKDERFPLVSVVIPSYEKAHFLAAAIDSVLAQTYPNVEVIVVDDGSRDNAGAVAARYPGVRYVRQKNGDVSAARNAGLRESSGAFLVFLDADDTLLPDALRVGMECFEREPHLRLVTGTYRYVDRDGHFLPSPLQAHVTEDHYAALLRVNYIGTPGTTIFRRLVLHEVGGYDQRFSGAEDYELVLRIVGRGYPIHCHEVAVLGYRRATNHLSDDSRRMLEDTLRALRLHRRHAYKNDHLRAAYSDGLDSWRRIYRPGLVDQICTSIDGHDRSGALRGMWTLLRHDRQGIRDVVRRSRDRRVASRLTG
jgi:glycosyltransferase involved in cell wall biosynthesis